MKVPYRLFCGDCLDKMKKIPDNYVDMVMCDPPYGTTNCKWDSIIPLKPMWEQLERICKKNAAIVMMASQPFTTTLISSNMKMFKYCWVWKKEKGGNIAVLKHQPSKVHEDVCVFSQQTHNYYPIMDRRPEANKRKNAPRYNKVGIQGGKEFYVDHSKGNSDFKYPISVREFNVVRGGTHPTQKPVALMEYLIKTYTNEGETVLDFAMGSGTTGVACGNLDRKFIGIELSEEYFQIAEKRIQKAYEAPGFRIEC